MLGRREWVAATASALMAGIAVIVLASLQEGPVVEVRVQAHPPLPEPDMSPGPLVWPPAPTCNTDP